MKKRKKYSNKYFIQKSMESIKLDGNGWFLITSGNPSNGF